MLFQKAPEVVYGLYGGLFIANIAMLLIGSAQFVKFLEEDEKFWVKLVKITEASVD